MYFIHVLSYSFKCFFGKVNRCLVLHCIAIMLISFKFQSTFILRFMLSYVLSTLCFEQLCVMFMYNNYVMLYVFMLCVMSIIYGSYDLCFTCAKQFCFAKFIQLMKFQFWSLFPSFLVMTKGEKYWYYVVCFLSNKVQLAKTLSSIDQGGHFMLEKQDWIKLLRYGCHHQKGG